MNRPVFARRERGFTLIEMLVSLVLLCLISLLLLTITGQTSRMWRYTTSRSEQFGAAGQAFDSISQRLSQATLNTYWDYDNPNKPTKYQRQSQLRFPHGSGRDSAWRWTRARPAPPRTSHLLSGAAGGCR